MTRVSLIFSVFISSLFTIYANKYQPERFYNDHTYLITFKATQSEDAQTVKSLLKQLHNTIGMDKAVFDRTHHFRTLPHDQALIGTIGVNASMGISKLTDLISKSKELTLTKTQKPTFEEFVKHVNKKQLQLSSNNSK